MTKHHLHLLSICLYGLFLAACAGSGQGVPQSKIPAVGVDTPHQLYIALEGQKLMLEFTLDADDFLSEQYPPSSPQYGEALKAMEKQLLKTDEVISFPVRAHCTMSAQSVEALPTQKGATIESSYNFTCLAPEALNRVQVMMFQHFPRLKAIQARTVIRNREGTQVLIPDNPSVRGFPKE